MSTVRIPLESQRYPGLFATIDEEDYKLVSQYRWRPEKARKKGSFFYAVACGNPHIRMHRVILRARPQDPEVDHADGDRLNNTRGNLRFCTRAQNAANRRLSLVNKSSQYRGVTWDKAHGRWRAAIKSNGRSLYLGLYDSEVDAARAYDAAAEIHHGEFALTNGLEIAS